MKAIEQIYQALLKLEREKNRAISANEISEATNTDRANISRYLNRLYEEKRIEKMDGRPVRFRSIRSISETISSTDNESSLDKMAVIQASMQVPIQQAKASILYPPKGLHTLILGETGVGKSMFAELMYQFAKEAGVVRADAPFVRFNCADYAENAQLLVSQIFGVKKGAYTGADKDREGLLRKADGGFLFLDEVHRLPPQGQEMLFTFIDKGIFQPLGDTEKTLSSEVRIIAATTEQPKSHLLDTFLRRIPMMIELPPLKAKALTERYYLVELFIRQESNRIGKSIYVDKNAIIAFLLYECPNNIGQLKSDIQLTCAKAFLNYKAKKESYILISTSDLPPHVCKGLLRIHDCRQDIEFLLEGKSPTIKFSSDQPEIYDTIGQVQGNEDFYDIIENRLKALKDSGLKDEEIKYAINMDIESHFKKYMGDIPARVQSKDLSKLVKEEIMLVAKEVLQLAEQKLHRRYEEKIYVGLALHLHGFVERIKKGNKIYHPKLNTIRVDYPEEFMTAMEAAKILDNSFGIHTPLDEIGYIAMFLSLKPIELNKQKNLNVAVLVLMHGNSTASSMADVCNSMIGIRHAEALDMPLSVSPDETYEKVKEKVIQLDQGRGVLLMVDMGSLTSFGQMLQEETGITIKTIDMASTPIIIDACRKALLGRDIQYIYDSIKMPVVQQLGGLAQEHSARKGAIITACFTGEGAAERLKHIIEESLGKDVVAVVPLDVMNKKQFLSRIEECKEKYKVLAIVSTLDVRLEGIPYISAADILTGTGIDSIRDILETESNYTKIAKSLDKHTCLDGEALIENLREMLRDLENALRLSLREEVKIGMLLHISFLLDKLKKGGNETYFEGLPDFCKEYRVELAAVRSILKNVERQYDVSIGEHEAAYICKMLMSNGEMVQDIV